MHRIARLFLCAGFACMVSPIAAQAQGEARTQLVRCGEESCLQVSGYRQHDAMEVLINGLVADVDGDNKWRVQLTIDTVRELSEPRARALTIAVRDPDTLAENVSRASLPIGLLGDVSSLGSLEITAP